LTWKLTVTIIVTEKTKQLINGTRHSSGDEIANVNFFYDIIHIVQIQKREPTSFSKLSDS